MNLPDLRNCTTAFTGHRPDKLGGYGEPTDLRLLKTARKVMAQCQPAMVISGMAIGWDMAVAYAAIEAKIPVLAAVPFTGQEKVWPQHVQDRYHAIIRKCHDVIVISEGGYAPWKMQQRNRWMVNSGQHLVSLWDGTPGGTANCVKFAQTKTVVGGEPYPITNVWPLWLETV